MNTSREETADVVIVGGGGAGLAAAVSAAQNGAKVVVLEKRAECGGTTGLSIGSITASGTRFQKAKGIEDSADAHFEDMELFLKGGPEGRENLALRRILVDEANATLEWLMDLGLHFFGPMAEPPHRVPRMHNVVPSSRAYPHVLSRACNKLNVRVERGVRAVSLICKGGAVMGVEAKGEMASIRYTARGGVILATGDFSASPEYKARYLPIADDIDGFNGASTGDGHRMAEGLGVPILNGDILWGPSMRFAEGSSRNLVRRIPPWPILAKAMAWLLARLPVGLFRPVVLSLITSSMAPEGALFKAGAILVNREGNRFADELDRPQLEIPKQSGKAAYIVFDETVARRFSAWPNFISTAPGVAYAYVSDYRRSQRHLYHRAKSIEQLARRIGVSPDALTRTVRAHNAQLAQASNDPRPAIGNAPYHALGPVMCWVVITEGGLAVSSQHEALDSSGAVVPGLYAVGSVGQGGLVLAGHGHHLGWAFTSGRRAGRIAAERAKQQTEALTQN